MKFKTTILILCLVGVASGAKYKGRDIDGKKYEATVKGEGVISPARVIFNGCYVEIYIGKRVIMAKMGSEIINDPHDIEASDEKQSWTIDIEGLD